MKIYFNLEDKKTHIDGSGCFTFTFNRDFGITLDKNNLPPVHIENFTYFNIKSGFKNKIKAIVHFSKLVFKYKS